MHFDLTNSKITVAEARFNSFPNKLLTAPKKDISSEWVTSDDEP